MELFNTILFWINNVIIFFCSLAFSTQLIYTLLFFLKPKKFKKSETIHKVSIVIPARNEESVIADTITNLKSLNYPKDKFNIYVLAHNCTDNTAKIAAESGAKVFEIFDDEPSHKNRGYCLKYGFERIFENDDSEFFILLDADTLLHPNYLEKMNDAFDSGVKLGRSYQNSKNLFQNCISGVSGLWYMRDCRFSCSTRSALHIGQMMVGSGMMVAKDILVESNGWDALCTSEDAEFTLNRLFQGHKSEFVSEAIIYEDQPVSIKDCYIRNTRIGNGLIKLFFSHALKSFFMFFKKWDFTYIDMFLTLLFIPIAVICCTWFPLYYSYDLIYSAIIGNMSHVYEVLIIIAEVIAFGFIIPFILQAILVTVLEHKKFLKHDKKTLVKTILLFPLFMIMYAIGITMGAITNPKWKEVKRSKTNVLEEINMLNNEDQIEVNND